MAEHFIPTEPDPDSLAVREYINCDPLTEYETLGEMRLAIDALDDDFRPKLADYLSRRTMLTDDAVRFKATLDQVVAVERQDAKLIEVDEWARKKHHRATGLLVDIVDTIATGSVARQLELFARTRPINMSSD